MVQGFEAGLSAAQHFQAKLVVLVNDAGLLDVFVCHHLGQHHTDLVVIRAEQCILQFIGRVIHIARRSQRHEVDDLFFKLDRHGRIVLRSAQMSGHDKNFVLVHQFLSCQHSTFGVITRVFHQQLEFATVDGALLIEFVDTQLHTAARLLAIARQRAGQILDGANNDFVFAHALLLGSKRWCCGAPRDKRKRQAGKGK